jgi:hypothetical protein
MPIPRLDVDIRIDLRRGYGVESIKVYADDSEQREAGLRALLGISTELDRIERKIKKDSQV